MRAAPSRPNARPTSFARPGQRHLPLPRIALSCLALACTPTPAPSEATAGQAPQGTAARVDSPPAPRAEPAATSTVPAATTSPGSTSGPLSATSAGTSTPAPLPPGTALGEAWAATAVGSTTTPGPTGAATASAPEAAGPSPGGTPETWLATVKDPKANDDLAQEALRALERAERPRRELARAALARGEALFESPERSAAFLEWARTKDPTFADPVFLLAKRRAMEGDIPATRELLQEVARRKGKKLLAQIDFDPIWEIVKDDPEVRKLLGGEP